MFYRHLKGKEAQGVIEYAIVVVVAVGLLISMSEVQYSFATGIRASAEIISQSQE